MKLPLLQVKIDPELGKGLPHHVKEEFSIPLEISFLLLIHGDLDRFFEKCLQAFNMIRMAVSDNDNVNLLRRDPVLLDLTKKRRNMLKVTGVNQNRDLTADQVAVTVVLAGILPEVDEKIFFQFHGKTLLKFSIFPPKGIKE
jgi:hypothetical protein